jgi:hypothetical protein
MEDFEAAGTGEEKWDKKGTEQKEVYDEEGEKEFEEEKDRRGLNHTKKKVRGGEGPKGFEPKRKVRR